METAEILAGLRAQAGNVATGQFQKRLKLGGSVELNLCFDVATATPSLRCVLPADPARHPANLPRYRGIDVDIVKSPTGALLEVALRDQGFESLFVALIEDITAAVRRRPVADDVGETVRRRLLLWKRFFEHEGPTEAELLGLFGELKVLREQVVPIAGLTAALDAWRGPEGADRDFLIRRIGIEVKATRDVDAPLSISSLDQLDGRALDGLFLVQIVVAATAQGTPLLDLCRSMLAEADELDRQTVLDKLSLLGIRHDALDELASLRFTFQKMRIFRVGPGFPSLTPASVPVGIVDARYQIATNDCLPWEVSVADLHQAIGSSSNGG